MPSPLASAVVVALLGCLPSVWAQELLSDPIEVPYPEVITPTRLRQSLADVPGSVTVISGETMRQFGITSVMEALRLVPGMAVAHEDGGDWRINYHGTNPSYPRRMNVLVDGISVYRPSFSRVEWTTLPVALEDIDRIEVIRGPDSSSYGPNSMLAVINILTRHPDDVEAGTLALTAGSQDLVQVTARAGATLGSTSFRLTANSERDSGFDWLNRRNLGRDSHQVRRIYVRSETDLGQGSKLGVQSAYIEGRFQEPLESPQVTTYPERRVRDYSLSARWTHPLSPTHELQLTAHHANNRDEQEFGVCAQQYLFLPQLYDLYRFDRSLTEDLARALARGASATNAFLVSLPPTQRALAQDVALAVLALGPAAATTSCGTTDENWEESRTALELQDTYVFSERLRVVGGVGWRQQRAESQTFLGGKASNSVRWAFGHAEWRVLDGLTVNLGGYAETNSLSGSSISPRLALNARLADNQTLRFVMSEGTRGPDLLEERADLSYTVTGLTPPVLGSATTAVYAQSARGNPNLKPERILSRELGYLLAVPGAGMVFDVKVFNDQLKDLISERVAINALNLTNGNSIQLTGVELQSTLNLGVWTAFLSYGFLEYKQPTIEREFGQYSKHSGGIGVSRAFGDAWRVSLAYYGHSGDNEINGEYGRTDLNIQHRFDLGNARCAVALGMSYFDSRVLKGFESAFNSTYDSPFAARLQLRVAF